MDPLSNPEPSEKDKSTISGPEQNSLSEPARKYKLSRAARRIKSFWMSSSDDESEEYDAISSEEESEDDAVFCNYETSSDDGHCVFTGTDMINLEDELEEKLLREDPAMLIYGLDGDGFDPLLRPPPPTFKPPLKDESDHQIKWGPMPEIPFPPTDDEDSEDERKFEEVMKKIEAWPREWMKARYNIVLPPKP